jgi:hypothetical protein
MLEKGFDRASALFQVQGRAALSTRGAPRPPRFPIRWNRLIENCSLRFKELEHVLIGKVGQLFRNMLETDKALIQESFRATERLL